jgi:hypothetical protein
MWDPEFDIERLGNQHSYREIPRGQFEGEIIEMEIPPVYPCQSNVYQQRNY